jgi:hypothetical protein
MTTFEIYHKHNQITHINNYKSNTTIDYVLINVIVINKTKLHKISTNLKAVVFADHEFSYQVPTCQQAIAAQGTV